MVKFIHMKSAYEKRAFKSLESNVFELIKDLDEVTVFVIDGDKKKMDKHFYNNLKRLLM